MMRPEQVAERFGIWRFLERIRWARWIAVCAVLYGVLALMGAHGQDPGPPVPTPTGCAASPACTLPPLAPGEPATPRPTYSWAGRG